MEKYKWFPTECAPRNYPAQIIKADFIYKNGESIFIPEGKVIQNGWGELGSTYIVGEDEKPIPSKLQIMWFSYTEDKFYSGLFDLPFDSISTLFKEGFISPTKKTKTTYRRIITGLAPGGFLSLWVAGEGIVKKVAIFQAKEINADWKNFFNTTEISRKQYIKEVLDESLSAKDLEVLQTKRVPLGLWNKYENLFNWMPVIIGSGKPTEIWIKTFNGEQEYLNYQTEAKIRFSKRALPQKLELRWQSNLQKNYSSTIQINEAEIFAAFEKLLTEANQNIRLQIEIHDITHTIELFVSNDKYIIELKEGDIKVYSN